MLTCLFVAAWGCLLIGSNTPCGQALERWMVQHPAEWLSRLSARHIATAAMFALIGGLLCWLDGDLARVFSMAAPELAATLAAIDASTLIDAAFVVIVTVSAMPWRALRKPGGRRVGLGTRSRQPRTRKAPPSNDDERLALAVAA